MIIGRRSFMGVAAMGAIAMNLKTCNIESALADLTEWIPEGIEAIDEIVTLINPAAGTILSTATSAIPGLWAAIAAGIAEYESTTPAPVGALQKVLTGLKDLSDNLTQVINALPSSVSIPAATLMAVRLGLKLTIATINWFAEKHGGTASPASKTAAGAAVCAKSRKDYVAKFNALKIPRPDGTLLAIR
jgi:hypothetical protein